MPPVNRDSTVLHTTVKDIVFSGYGTYYTSEPVKADIKSRFDSAWASPLLSTHLGVVVTSFSGSASGRRLQTSLDEITVSYTMSGFDAAAVDSAQAAIEADTGGSVASAQNSQMVSMITAATGAPVQVLLNPAISRIAQIVPAPSLPPGASYPASPNAPSSSSSDDSTGVIVAVVVVVVLLLGAGVGFVLYKRKQAKPVYPA
jgi:uncharacterized membrane protein